MSRIMTGKLMACAVLATGLVAPPASAQNERQFQQDQRFAQPTGQYGREFGIQTQRSYQEFQRRLLDLQQAMRQGSEQDVRNARQEAMQALQTLRTDLEQDDVRQAQQLLQQALERGEPEAVERARQQVQQAMARAAEQRARDQQAARWMMGGQPDFQGQTDQRQGFQGQGDQQQFAQDQFRGGMFDQQTAQRRFEQAQGPVSDFDRRQTTLRQPGFGGQQLDPYTAALLGQQGVPQGRFDQNLAQLGQMQELSPDAWQAIQQARASTAQALQDIQNAMSRIAQEGPFAPQQLGLGDRPDAVILLQPDPGGIAGIR